MHFRPKQGIRGTDEYLFKSQTQQGLLAAVHSAFVFLPLRTFAPAEEIARMKKVLEEDKTFGGDSGLKKRHELLKEWFDDERHAQAE